MLRQMRSVWDDFNGTRRELIKKELAVARARQAEVVAYWNGHKITVLDRWANRSGGRGEVTVADIPEVAAQWHRDNLARPENVLATAQRRGEASPYLWRCPLGFGHEPWPAWPKDRIQKGPGCPECRRLIRLADLPTLAARYRGQRPASDITHASHERVLWICRTWGVDPSTGAWRPVEHRFEAVVKERALQGDGCLVCAGYVIDDTNSLFTWFPDIADELDAPDLDPRRLPTSQHNVSRKHAAEAGNRGVYATLSWRCRHGHGWKATVLNRVQGTGCGKCSTSGISKEQVRLVAELAGLIDLVPPESRDPRLPAGAPDFASHRLTVPPEHKPAHWRYKDVEVDAVFHLPHGVRVGLEHDGAFHHSTRQRDRRQYENDKSRVLVAAGLLDLLIHVRIGDLPEMEAPTLWSWRCPNGPRPTSRPARWPQPSRRAFPRLCRAWTRTSMVAPPGTRPLPMPTSLRYGESCVLRAESRRRRARRHRAASLQQHRMQTAGCRPCPGPTGIRKTQMRSSVTTGAGAAIPRSSLLPSPRSLPETPVVADVWPHRPGGASDQLYPGPRCRQSEPGLSHGGYPSVAADGSRTV